MSGNLIASGHSGPYLPNTLIISSDFALSPATATAWIQFRNDGKVYDHDNNYLTDWIQPTSDAPGDWEIKANSSSPDTPDSGTMDTWLALSSSRTWSETRSGIGVDTKNFTIELRRASGASQRTRSCRLIADVDI